MRGSVRTAFPKVGGMPCAVVRSRFAIRASAGACVPLSLGPCRCDVCDGSQDDGRRTVSEQSVQRITSKETAQT